MNVKFDPKITVAVGFKNIDDEQMSNLSIAQTRKYLFEVKGPLTNHNA